MAKNWVVHPPLDERRELTCEQAAYIAGFVDGEGTIRVRISRRDGRDSNLSHGWHWQFEIFNTNLKVLEIIQEWTGVGAIYGREPRIFGHKESYQWSVFSLKALYVLQQIVPYLIVKKRRAELIVSLDAIRQSRKKGNRVFYTDEDLIIISRLFEEIKRENETGSLDVKLLHRPEDSETVQYIRPKSERLKPGPRRTFCKIEGCEQRIKKATGGLCAEHAKERSREERRRTVQCEECGAEIETLESRTRFCSAKCQTWNSYKRRTGKGVAEQKTCEGCGAPIETSVSKKRFCSQPCQSRAKYKERLQNGYFERRKANGQLPLIE